MRTDTPDTPRSDTPDQARASAWDRMLGFFVDNKLVAFVLLGLLVLGGLHVSPFDWDLAELPRNPVPVDALPDIGENQQIVFTEWPGRSPRDIEDQVTYPLTTALLGIPGVRTVRSSSMFGFSTIYVIFEDDVDFYWSRSRVLEKLASLPRDLLPDEVSPTLGPDATALGQVFWYSLEGHDPAGELVGGWSLDELRSIQDWTVRLALQSVPGVSEVASVGGYVKEYQIDVDPEALLAHGVGLDEVTRAVRRSNLDVGARTLEINRSEYLVRGLGFVEEVDDLAQAVVRVREHVPIRVEDVAHVSLGPAQRRGALDDEGAETVGGVVVVRHGANPLEVIERIKAKIAEIAPGLPKRTLDDGTVSQVHVTPFYDRATLIQETLGTLSTALLQQILITVVVVLVMLRRLRTSLLVSLMLPLGVLLTFVAMKIAGVDANIMALAGVAIAIGTMVDIGIVFTENITQHLDQAPPTAKRAALVTRAAAEVAPAVLTSVATTVVSFLPVFALTASEGKLFAPLAYTKTFAMAGTVLIAMLALPALAHLVLWRVPARTEPGRGVRGAFTRARRLPYLHDAVLVCVAGVVTWHLAADWAPLSYGTSMLANLLFVAGILTLVLGGFSLFQRVYPRVLGWCLRHKLAFLAVPCGFVLLGATAWLGFGRMFAWLPEGLRSTAPSQALARTFPGFGREFMPPFDEGAYLYMPTTMPHASFGAAREMLQHMDAAIAQIPEVERAVGKLGRADSALDPAPISMFETIVTYKPEYRTEPDGTRVRQWRDHIRSPDDIWQAILAAGEQPGLTSAPRLMPIQTRIVMLQSGMRAPMGIKIRGPDLETLEAFGMQLEKLLQGVDVLRPEMVIADRVVGKPYLEIDIDRRAIARYGLAIQDVQEVIQVGLGGQPLSVSVEGRERYPIRVRYLREDRDSIEALRRVLISAPGGEQIPLEQVAEIRYVRGPQVIKSEDTFLTSYVLFDKRPEVSEVEAVERTAEIIQAHIDDGSLQVPAGVSYTFAGSYENQVRSEKRLAVLLPVALAVIFLLLYLQFRRVGTSLMIYSGVAVAVSGGFLLLWLYNQPWFLDIEVLGTSMRTLFQVGPINLSVAVWVGFIALVGIATDDGVVMATYLDQRFRAQPPQNAAEVRERTLEAGLRRVRPCLMTTATTLIALLPVITSRGRGSDVMVPIALPVVGGMLLALVTLFVVPVLYASRAEAQLARAQRRARAETSG